MTPRGDLAFSSRRDRPNTAVISNVHTHWWEEIKYACPEAWCENCRRLVRTFNCITLSGAKLGTLCPEYMIKAGGLLSVLSSADIEAGSEGPGDYLR